jgi:hypothetical protein
MLECVFKFELNFELLILLHTVNSLLSGMYWGWGMVIIFSCISKVLTELIFHTISALFKSSDIPILCFKIKITSFHFSSCAGAFSGDTLD